MTLAETLFAALEFDVLDLIASLSSTIAQAKSCVNSVIWAPASRNNSTLTPHYV